MNAATSLALAVKELEPGEFHWMLLEEDGSLEDGFSFKPRRIGEPETDTAAAWVAGYLALRAALRAAKR
ncbi:MULTISPECIES: hypothetical protein [unclassified Variovorax]|jgi:hypothetical protein|uniref:hypothetical protein n=1 Tax=unclassified Variovorax TaxID=663243 RepID=UPI0019B4D460|nr:MULTISPECIES: hypothetical protein [unclassified Variovorax]MBC7391834.1 hypothetical protein [Variovorax sp.]MEB0058666.1 hypothetical protein [Variovorax sp. LG9.2]MEB0111611.1 hypothetical protein [Variovorax sp. RTB1]